LKVTECIQNLRKQLL